MKSNALTKNVLSGLLILITLGTSSLIHAVNPEAYSHTNSSSLVRTYSTQAGYLNSLRKTVAAYPHDLNAAVYFAEALLKSQNGDYWEADRITPTPATREAIIALNKVLQKEPEHKEALRVVQHLKLYKNLIPHLRKRD